MRFFKYLIILLSLFASSFLYAGFRPIQTDTYGSKIYNSIDSLCSDKKSYFPDSVRYSIYRIGKLRCNYHRQNDEILGGLDVVDVAITCPSATEVTLKVPVNAQKYQCVNQCQYALRGCVDIDFEPGMTCSAISTGIECGKTPPTPPKDPTDTSQSPDSDSVSAAPGQNSSNTNTNSATTTGSSTSTSTSNTTNNTTTNTSTTNTTTTTNINTTTKIDLSSLESAIESIGKLLGDKLDSIKDAIAGSKDQDGGDSGSDDGSGDCNSDSPASGASSGCEDSAKDILDWLKGDGDKGGVGGEGDNPFGTDVTPQREITPQSLQTNIFGSAAACPADRTLSMNFLGKSFQKTFSFSLWCQQLAILGSLILIAAYAYGAYIIASKS